MSRGIHHQPRPPAKGLRPGGSRERRTGNGLQMFSTQEGGPLQRGLLLEDIPAGVHPSGLRADQRRIERPAGDADLVLQGDLQGDLLEVLPLIEQSPLTRAASSSSREVSWVRPRNSALRGSSE